jgi:hypothetical protein
MPSPTVRRLAAPELLSPSDGASFVGWNAEVVLQWSQVAGLGQNEYYVVRIPYDDVDGVAEFWRKETAFRVPQHFSQSNVGFSDRHYNWTVQVMRCTEYCDKVLDDNTRKQGVAAGDRSREGIFFWQPDTGGGASKEPTNTPAP